MISGFLFNQCIRMYVRILFELFYLTYSNILSELADVFDNKLTWILLFSPFKFFRKIKKKKRNIGLKRSQEDFNHWQNVVAVDTSEFRKWRTSSACEILLISVRTSENVLLLLVVKRVVSVGRYFSHLFEPLFQSR